MPAVSRFRHQYRDSARSRPNWDFGYTDIGPILQVARDGELVGVGTTGRDGALRDAGRAVGPICTILRDPVEVYRRRLVEQVSYVDQDQVSCSRRILGLIRWVTLGVWLAPTGGHTVVDLDNRSGELAVNQ